MKAKTKTKALLMSLCAVLLVAASVLGTMAYLTDSKDVKNTFTVGNVAITLDEAKVDDNGNAINKQGNQVTNLADAERVPGNAYKLLPGHTYVKDPTVTVLKPSVESYVRMKVTFNNATELIKICTDPEFADVETGLEKAYPEVRMLKFSTNSEMFWVSPLHPENGTLDMEDGINDPKYCVYDQKADTLTYTFYYADVLNGTDTVTAADTNVVLPTLFDSITLPEWVTGDQLAKLKDFQINVVAEAIQADGFKNADAAWAAFAAQQK